MQYVLKFGVLVSLRQAPRTRFTFSGVWRHRVFFLSISGCSDVQALNPKPERGLRRYGFYGVSEASGQRGVAERRNQTLVFP